MPRTTVSISRTPTTIPLRQESRSSFSLEQSGIVLVVRGPFRVVRIKEVAGFFLSASWFPIPRTWEYGALGQIVAARVTSSAAVSAASPLVRPILRAGEVVGIVVGVVATVVLVVLVILTIFTPRVKSCLVSSVVLAEANQVGEEFSAEHHVVQFVLVDYFSVSWRLYESLLQLRMGLDLRVLSEPLMDLMKCSACLTVTEIVNFRKV